MYLKRKSNLMAQRKLDNADSSSADQTAVADDGPLYRRLAEVLIGKIDSGIIGDNQAIPSERDLVVEYNVSRDTVRKAVRYLEERGVLYSEHGRGTFVTPAVFRRMTRSLDSFSQDSTRRGAAPGQRILSIESLPASMAIAGVLGLEPGHPLTRLRRVRTFNGNPVGLHDAYLSLPDGARFDRGELERCGSLYRLFQEKFDITPAEAVENLTVGLADDDEASLLQVAVGSPLLVCERVTLTDRREPVEYCLMKYVPSYRYTMRINKHGMAT
jgi:GntR family transcriptional regulator